jgi:hypothetical protein
MIVYFNKNGKTFFDSVVSDKIVCHICSKGLLAPKEYNLRHHYETLHKDKFGVLEVKLKEDKLKNLKSDLQRQQDIFTVVKSNEAAVHAACKLCYFTNYCREIKPFTDGEFVL